MHPPGPFPPPPPGGSPVATATALTRALMARGITGIYTATDARFGLVSVNAAVTAWTNGHQIWCNSAGQRHIWSATDIEAASASLAALARPAADRPKLIRKPEITRVTVTAGVAGASVA